MAAAIRLFADLGYVATSMNNIASEAKVSKSLLYHHFTNKEALLQECLEERVQELLALMQDAAQAHDARSKISQLVRLFLAAYAKSQPTLKVLLNDTHHLPIAVATPIKKAQAQMVKTVCAWCAAEEGSSEQNAYPKAMALFGMMNWSFTWLKPEGSLSHEHYADIVVDLFFNGLH